MGSKINLNISLSWEKIVRPILDKWTDEYGGYSDMICEAISFLEEAKASKVYEAIMQYDTKLALAQQKAEETFAKEWKTIAKKMLDKDKDPTNFLTKAPKGPLLTPSMARQVIKKLRFEISNEAKQIEQASSENEAAMKAQSVEVVAK